MIGTCDEHHFCFKRKIDFLFSKSHIVCLLSPCLKYIWGTKYNSVCVFPLKFVTEPSISQSKEYTFALILVFTEPVSSLCQEEQDPEGTPARGRCRKQCFSRFGHLGEDNCPISFRPSPCLKILCADSLEKPSDLERHQAPLCSTPCTAYRVTLIMMVLCSCKTWCCKWFAMHILSKKKEAMHWALPRLLPNLVAFRVIWMRSQLKIINLA